MISFESNFMQLIKNKKFLVNCVVGSLLCFIPILHFFAFGYLYRLAISIRENGKITFPDWEDLSALFLDGMKITVIVLFYVFLPFVLASFFSTNLVIIKLLISLFSMSFFAAVFYRYLYFGNFTDIFNFKLYFNMTLSMFPSQLITLIVAYAFFVFLFPNLYGFSIYISLLILLIQTTFHFYFLEKEKFKN